eukprot:6256785-Pyramimonas_sp.AAC.1
MEHPRQPLVAIEVEDQALVELGGLAGLRVLALVRVEQQRPVPQGQAARRPRRDGVAHQHPPPLPGPH